MSELRVDSLETRHLQNDAGDNLLEIDPTSGEIALGDNVEGITKKSAEWTTATRPTAQIGVFGYNSDLGYTEMYNGRYWQPWNEKGIVHKGLLVHLDTHDIDSYQPGGSNWFSLGRFGYNFEGNGGYLSVENGLKSGSTFIARAFSGSRGQSEELLNNDDHTIGFAIRFNGTGTYPNGWSGSWNKIFEHTGSSGDRSPGVWRFPSRRYIHWRYNPSNRGIDFGKNSAGNDFDLDQWYYVTVTKRAAAVVNYVNGVQVNNGNVANPKQTGNSRVRLFPGYPVDLANMNDLVIYNRPLEAAEVAQNFDSVRDKYGI